MVCIAVYCFIVVYVPHGIACPKLQLNAAVNAPKDHNQVKGREEPSSQSALFVAGSDSHTTILSGLNRIRLGKCGSPQR